jgi:hypothetical protein
MRAWWGRRLLYYAGMFGLFLMLAFYVGPNEFLFHTILYPYHSLADYKPEIGKDCVPLVRAVKEYRRDHGQLPEYLDQLIPTYLASLKVPARMWNDQLFVLKGDHLICYDFTPASEGWTVSDAPIDGAVPAPLVTISPATRPASAPAQ